jgi:C-terminal processing protease CtpA/Prc
MTKAVQLFMICLLLAVRVHAGSGTNELHEASEVIDALKVHYVDREKLDAKLLNDATVTGILNVLGQGAQLLSADQVASNATAAVPATKLREPLARAEIIEPSIGYIRIADVTDETVAALDAELKRFSAGKADGYVLDLRFADGTNYAAAAAVASRLLPPDQELFAVKRAGGDTEKFRTSEAKESLAAELSDVPVMLLVNGETRGSAEALAGALRAQDRGIVIGAKTAGSAAEWQDIKLKDGRVLRVATAKITLPKSGEIFPDGIVPDVPVKIDPKVEADVLLNAATNVTLTTTLQPRTKKKGLSEADLVKVYRGEAISTNEPPAASEEDSEVQKVRDVVLQRSVDILKGIRVLLSWQ